jgi:hypothetical protein
LATINKEGELIQFELASQGGIDMKTYIIAAVATLLVASISAFADPPAGVGSADISQSPCMVQTTVTGDGSFTPFLPGGLGVLLVEIGEAQVVESNSARGNVHLSCHGQLTFGDYVEGYDFVTGDIADGFLPTGPESCESLIAAGFPDACRGKGQQSVVIIDEDFDGQPCFINSVLSYDWRAVYAPGKGVSLICHGYE